MYRAVAGLVDELWEVDFAFAAAMVQAFNLILLTSPEVGGWASLTGCVKAVGLASSWGRHRGSGVGMHESRSR